MAGAAPFCAMVMAGRAGANAGASFAGRSAMITLFSTDHRAAAEDGPVFVMQ
jgi:hypothetical protein